MKDAFSTQLRTSLRRTADGLVDEIAKDGLHILKGILDSAGFGSSPYLNDYDLLVHVSGGSITFEVVVDFEALEDRDKLAQEIVESARMETRSPSKTWRIGDNGVERVTGSRDARSSARDARRPASDARKTSSGRAYDHAVAASTPRSMEMTRTGKLSMTFRKSLKDEGEEIRYPRGKLQGLLSKFMDELSSTIEEKFAPALERVLERHLR